MKQTSGILFKAPAQLHKNDKCPCECPENNMSTHPIPPVHPGNGQAADPEALVVQAE